jgi:AcrR family transcriptional regulator
MLVRRLRQSPGRPRDASISERALAAARELLVQRGFDATTIQAVAEHSGVHASAIYRRWPSRIELIEEATFPGLSPLSVQPTGDLRQDLHRFIHAYLAVFSAPAARAAAAGLLAHYQTARARPVDHALLPGVAISEAGSRKPEAGSRERVPGAGAGAGLLPCAAPAPGRPRPRLRAGPGSRESR